MSEQPAANSAQPDPSPGQSSDPSAGQPEAARVEELAAAERLRRLQIITDAVRAHWSLDDLKRDLLERTCQLLGGDAALILLLTNDEQFLTVEASIGLPVDFEQQQREIRIPFGQGVAGRIAAEGRPLIFDDLEKVTVINPLLRDNKVRSLVGAPLMVDDRVIGVLHVCTFAPHRFTPDDGRLLQLAADRFALAVERARLHAAVREGEDRKSAMLEAALDCIIMMDGEGRIAEFNPAAERTFGYTREQALGQALGDLIVPAQFREAHRKGLRHYLASGEGPVLNQRFEITALRRDGTEFPVELAIVPVQLQGRPTFCGYVRDITERKQLEAEREQLLGREQAARAEAEQANRAKDEFLATLSHELRTPLTSMMGWAEMLRTRSLDSAATQRALETITRNAKAQAALIEDLLDVSRIITGKLVLEMRLLELGPILQDAIDAVRPAAEAKNIRIWTDLNPDDGTVSGDAHRLQQVLWNLLSNAIKFTPKGGRVEVSLQRVESYAQVSISDNGEGIDAAFLPHVFDRLRQADNSNTRRHGGLGLGLAIVRYLIEMHGGTVWAQSAGAGQGSTFTLRLPLQGVRPPAELAANDDAGPTKPLTRSGLAAVPAASALNGLKVLVVDDETDTRRMVAAVLEQSGAAVTTAASVAEGWQELQRLQPAVLVSDIGMPGENGYDLIRKIRALPAEQGGQTPALALTAYAAPADRTRALEAGFHAYLSKPVEPADLIGTVAALSKRSDGPAAS